MTPSSTVGAGSKSALNKNLCKLRLNTWSWMMQCSDAIFRDGAPGKQLKGTLLMPHWIARFDNYVSLLHSINVLERSIVKEILFLISTTSVLGFRSRKVFMAMIVAGEMVHWYQEAHSCRHEDQSYARPGFESPRSSQNLLSSISFLISGFLLTIIQQSWHP